MSNLVIYNKENQGLSNLKFVKDINNQTRIDEITNLQEFKDQLAIIFTNVSLMIGIKDPISDLNKTDIKEMILMRFKELSLDELCYAFKLERYGDLGDKTGHYQLFNADYVSTVLYKYKKWKVDIIRNNLTNRPMKQESTISEEDKENIMLEAVDRVEREIKHNKKITGTYTHVYDYLYKEGLLPKHDKEFKDSIQDRAKAIAKGDAATAAQSDYNIHRQLKDTLASIEMGTSPKVKSIAKRIILEDYFKNK